MWNRSSQAGGLRLRNSRRMIVENVRAMSAWVLKIEYLACLYANFIEKCLDRGLGDCAECDGWG